MKLGPNKRTEISISWAPKTYLIKAINPYSQGLISPRAFKELIRITRPGGVIAWNIATGYEAYGRDYERYEEIVMGLVRDKAWEFLKPVKVNVFVWVSDKNLMVF